MVTPKKMVSGQWPKTSPNGSPAVQGEQWGRSLWGERSSGGTGEEAGSSRNCSGEPPTARLGCRMYSSGDTSVIFFWDQDLAVCYKLPLICALFYLPHVSHASIWLYFQQIFVWPQKEVNPFQGNCKTKDIFEMRKELVLFPFTLMKCIRWVIVIFVSFGKASTFIKEFFLERYSFAFPCSK